MSCSSERGAQSEKKVAICKPREQQAGLDDDVTGLPGDFAAGARWIARVCKEGAREAARSNCRCTWAMILVKIVCTFLACTISLRSVLQAYNHRKRLSASAPFWSPAKAN